MKQSSEKNRKKRYFQSCDQCRTSRKRCELSDDPDNKCVRCSSLGHTCIFSELRERARRNTARRASTTTFEQPYSLDQRNGSRASIYSDNEQLTNHQSYQQATPPALNRTLDSAQLPQSQTSQALTIDTTTSHGTLQDFELLYDGLITTHEAEQFLRAFQHDHNDFPFVIIPSLSLTEFYTFHPFLLLAILATATQRRNDLHVSISLRLRQTLATKIVVENVKSFDLLSALTVYLAWHHLNSMNNNQMYMMTQLAIALSVEMVDADNDNLALKRALAGLHLISSCASFTLSKPVNTGLLHHIETACQSLTAESQVDSDKILVHAIQVQRVVEETASISHHHSPVRSNMSAETIELMVESFKSRLQHLQTSSPQYVNMPAPFRFVYDSAYMTLYEVFLRIHPSSQPSPNPELSPSNTQQSFIRTRLLLSCYEATKTLLDKNLRLSTHDIEQQTVIEQDQFAHAFMTLIKLSLCSQTGIEPLHFRRTCNVPYYLDGIARIARQIGGSVGDANGHVAFQKYEQRITRVKEWYEQIDSGGLRKGSGGVDALSPAAVFAMNKNVFAEEENLDLPLGDLDHLWFFDPSWT